jgi:hypothetical protein
MCSTQNNSSSFAKEVAVSLTQSLEARDEYLKTECPVCLDEPKITDAVHTPCAHMFCMVSGAVFVTNMSSRKIYITYTSIRNVLLMSFENNKDGVKSRFSPQPRLTEATVPCAILG